MQLVMLSEVKVSIVLEVKAQGYAANAINTWRLTYCDAAHNMIICICFLCTLKGLEIQPALSVLSTHCGHTRFSKPQVDKARVRHIIWRPLPQLHSRTPADPVLPAYLCSGIGAVQRGENTWRIMCYTYSASSVSVFLPSSRLSPFVSCFPSDISTPIVYVFTHQRSYPSHLSRAVTSQSSSCVRPSH